MNSETIKAIRYIDSFLTILVECYQHDNGHNEWYKVTQSDTWSDLSNKWLVYLVGNVNAYGLELYNRLSRCNITPLHVLPHKPIVDRAKVDWFKVGEGNFSFRT